MNAMSDSEPSLNPPASVATKLEIPEGTFVLTYDKLDSEAIIRSAQDDTAGAIAVFIGTTRNSFQGASKNSSLFLRALMSIVLGLRSGCDALGIPSIQHNGYGSDDGHIPIHPCECNSVRTRCAIWTTSFPAVTLRRAPPAGGRSRWRSLDCHSSVFTPSEGSFRGVRVPFGTG